MDASSVLLSVPGRCASAFLQAIAGMMDSLFPVLSDTEWTFSRELVTDPVSGSDCSDSSGVHIPNTSPNYLRTN